MWLYLIGALLVLLGIVGAFAGGIYTLILIPLGFVMIASAAGYAMWGRAAHGAGGADTDAHPATAAPLPHSGEGDSGHVPSSPEALVDARRAHQ